MRRSATILLSLHLLSIFQCGLSEILSNVIPTIPKTSTLLEKCETVRDFLSLKAGPGSKQSYWHFSGVLRNPLTGAAVAGIEGVEIVRPIGSAIARRNTPSTNESSDDYTRTFLSKKMFMYVDKTNRSSLIEEYRLQRQAPLRPVVPTKEFVEQVTLSVTSAGDTSASILWPGSLRTITTNKIKIEAASGADSLLDQIRGRKKLNVVNFMTAGVPLHKIPKNSFRRWISFSPGGQSEGAGRSQEYYTISNCDIPGSVVPSAVQKVVGVAGWKALFGKKVVRPDAVMTYQRHGEGPAWYAVGRACVIELTGARYSTAKALPSYVRELVSRAQPGFFDLSLPSTLTIDACANNRTSTESNSPVLVQSKRKQGLLSPEWFDQQADPMALYKPWYSHIRPFLSNLRK